MEERVNKVSRPKQDKLLRQLSWDYDLPEADIRALLEGKRERAGHYTRHELFRKLLETYPWFTILQLIPVKEVKELLTDDVINTLRSPSLKKKYEFIRYRLHQVI